MNDERRTPATPRRTVPWTVALDVRAADADVDRAGSGGLDEDGLDAAVLSGASPQVVAAAARRLAKFDAAVCDALHDAPVPDDLPERLLALIAAEQAAAGMSAGSPAEATAPERRAPSDVAQGQPLLTPPKRLSLGRRLARRPWTVRVALATAAALLVGFIGFAFRNPHVQLTAATLEAAVRELHGQAAPAAANALRVWPNYPLSRYVSPRQAVASQTLPVVDGLTGAAYRLQNPRGGTATLYVLACPPSQGSAAWASAPSRRPLSTQGLASSVWRENERLYVLVVDGNERDYLEFLRFQDAAVG